MPAHHQMRTGSSPWHPCILTIAMDKSLPAFAGISWRSVRFLSPRTGEAPPPWSRGNTVRHHLSAAGLLSQQRNKTMARNRFRALSFQKASLPPVGQIALPMARISPTRKTPSVILESGLYRCVLGAGRPVSFSRSSANGLKSQASCRSTSLRYPAVML